MKFQEEYGTKNIVGILRELKLNWYCQWNYYRKDEEPSWKGCGTKLQGSFYKPRTNWKSTKTDMGWRFILKLSKVLFQNGTKEENRIKSDLLLFGVNFPVAFWIQRKNHIIFLFLISQKPSVRQWQIIQMIY